LQHKLNPAPGKAQRALRRIRICEVVLERNNATGRLPRPLSARRCRNGHRALRFSARQFDLPAIGNIASVTIPSFPAIIRKCRLPNQLARKRGVITAPARLLDGFVIWRH
jgi:hypothetical protein